MNYPAFHYRVYDKTVQSEPAFIIYDLTFVYISFTKNFCQEKVKKNCKSAVRVFFKNTDMGREKKHEKHKKILRG